MTDCPACRWAEMSRRDQLLTVALGYAERFLSPGAQAQRAVAASLAQFARVMQGQPLPSWYERHRAAFIERGDWTELARMLRHVTPN